MATFIAKITDVASQYNSATSTITWRDPTQKRWVDTYGKLKNGDNCIFVSGSELYVGDYASTIRNKSVTFNNIKSVHISTDDLLRIDVLNPEYYAVLKRPPGPLLRATINVNKIYNAAKSKDFISFYIVRQGKEAGILPTLKKNDRVITIDKNDRLIEISVVDKGTLKPKSFGVGYFNCKGKTLSDILNITKVAQRNKSSNNVKNIQRIIKELGKNDSFKFPSFNGYYNIIHNKRLYSNSPSVVDADVSDSEDDNNNENIGSDKMPKNIILYGPPGTGKTYSTIDKAIEIIDGGLPLERTAIKKRFGILQGEGRIFFTTFHQNMAYEDFIEGIKPLEPDPNDDFLKYEVKDGLFMKACVEATFNYIQSNLKQENEVKKLLDFNAYFDKLHDRVENLGKEKIKTKSKKEVTATITSQGNFSINHEGSEKPYTVSRDRLSKLFEKYPEPDEITNVQDAFRRVIGGCNSTAYWSVLKEIAIIRDNEGKEKLTKAILPVEIPYEDKRKIVQQYWDKKDYSVVPDDKSHPYVFIIDEINRGNVAQIFGELITLIEDDKRMGKLETLYAELPYSKHSFSTPPNLYIIGTMNTADRSVEALDTALRRRFSFVPKMPDETKLTAEFDGINIKLLLTSLNNRLRILKDNDHTIGHAWLWGINNFEGLKVAFKDKIIPLLQEYFYNDFEKLGLVLGNKFVITENIVRGQTFATFPDSIVLANQYRNRKVYRIKPDEEATQWQPDDFISIYNQIAPVLDD